MSMYITEKWICQGQGTQPRYEAPNDFWVKISKHNDLLG